jgi:hypothetical protein
MQAQWNVYDSGKEYQVLVSTAQGQPAIYKNVPCEVKLVSLKNKTLKLTSSNATVTPNAEPGSFTIQTSDENAVLQIYSAKKSKMKLLKEIQIRTVDVPLLDELTLSGNSLSVGYSYNMQFASGYDPSPYDQQVFSKYYSLESWAFSCPAARKNLYGSGNQLSQEVTSFLRYLPEGVSYEIIGYHNGPINPGDYQANVPQSFASQNSELPGAKYVVLNNTPANKSFFDPNDPNSLIGLVNNNYFSFPDLNKGVFFTSKSTPENGGEFILANKVNSGIKNYIPKGFSTYLEEDATTTIKQVLNSEGISQPVYYKKGSSIDIKRYNQVDYSSIETIDTLTETADPSIAELDANGFPVEVNYKIINVIAAYSTDSISQIVIRYDSTLNLSSCAVELIPSRFSFARKLGKSDTLDIVFSMKFKDLMSGDTSNLFAPTIHVKNDKSNASYFDLENPKSLLGYLNTKKVRESGIASFPMLNRGGAAEFGDDCDPNGKSDNKLFEVETILLDYPPMPKTFLEKGMEVPIYHKKGSTINVKEYNSYNGDETIVDNNTETTDPSEAEIIPGTDQPYQVEYRIIDIKNSQYKSLTDLFIKRKYLFDPTYGVYVAKPTTIGFAQQMPGQTKPTLIMQVDLTSDPKLLSMLPKMQSQLFLGQPWALSLIQNDLEAMGETIDASNIPALQKKFQFRKKMVSLMGDMEISNEPHF